VRTDWDTYFLGIAQAVATRATCPRASHGAVIVSEDRRILATGYNGAPAGVPHCTEVGCAVVNNHCVRVIHAEANAILQAGRAAQGAAIYITGQPCLECCKVIVQAGISEVYYPTDNLYQDNRCQAMGVAHQDHYLAASGVKVYRIWVE